MSEKGGAGGKREGEYEREETGREGGREGRQTESAFGVRACVKMAKSESVMLIGGVKS